MCHPPSRRGRPILARTGVNRAELPAIARSGSGARDRAPPDRLESLALFARLVCRPLWPRPAERRSTRPTAVRCARRLSLPPVGVRQALTLLEQPQLAGGIGGHVAVRADAVLPPKCQMLASGKMPSPRSASVDRAEADHRLASVTISSSSVGQVRAVHQAPAVVELGGVRQQRQWPAVEALETVSDLLRLLGQMDVDWQAGALLEPAATAAVIAAGGTARTECSASPRQRFGSSAKTRSMICASCTQPSGSSAKRRCAPPGGYRRLPPACRRPAVASARSPPRAPPRAAPRDIAAGSS